MQNTLLIFAKYPQLGKVKTRLATDIGNEKALIVYKQLLFQTFDMANEVGAFVMACFTQKDELTLDTIPYDRFYLQTEGDLGVKLYNALEYAFYLGAQNAIVIGTDCSELSPEIIHEAYSQLENHDCVVGPAKDGGYYLIGMKASKPYLFQNIDWSTDVVLKQTCQTLEARGDTFFLLQELSDIDTLEDLKQSNEHVLKRLIE